MEDRMKILRSTPFVLLYISVAILVAGCVLGGMKEAFKPFDVELVACALGGVGAIFTMITTSLAGYYLYKKIEDGKIEEDDDGD
jgi:hypothetical protein